MKYQVSVLSDKGSKKTVATVNADYYVESRRDPNKDKSAIMFLSANEARIAFYLDNSEQWFTKDVLVASVVVTGGYVIEQVS